MYLHLIRHGKTDQYSSTGSDYDRKLLPKGHQQLILLNEVIKPRKTDIIWSSSAIRAAQTAKALFPEESINFFDEFYLCSRDTFLKSIWQCDHSDDLWIFAHNFGISDLASYFLDEDILMRTSEYIRIRFDIEAWNLSSRGNGLLDYRFHPRP